MLTTTVPKGIKLEVFVHVDNVVVIKLQDNCKFWNYKISCSFAVTPRWVHYDVCGQACSDLNHDGRSFIWPLIQTTSCVLRVHWNARCMCVDWIVRTQLLSCAHPKRRSLMPRYTMHTSSFTVQSSLICSWPDLGPGARRSPRLYPFDALWIFPRSIARARLWPAGNW